jgi:hypothetical protein
MNGDNSVSYVIGAHRNKIFWALFIVLGATLISGMIANMFYVDVLLGLFVITIGLYKLGEEFITNSFRKEQQRVSEDMDNIMEWLSHSYDFTKRLKDSHENRIHHLDSKRAEMGDKVENNYRELVKKIIQVENKLNRTTREMSKERILINRVDRLADLLVKERRMVENKVFDVSDRQFRALRAVRKDGMIRTGDYAKTFRVRDKTALIEINDLVKKGFLKKSGKGRGIHYILGF